MLLYLSEQTNEQGNERTNGVRARSSNWSQNRFHALTLGLYFTYRAAERVACLRRFRSRSPALIDVHKHRQHTNRLLMVRRAVC
jgi:hypothetical protein